MSPASMINFIIIIIATTTTNEVSSMSIADKLHSPFASEKQEIMIPVKLVVAHPNLKFIPYSFTAFTENDCFKRIWIGQRLVHYDVTRTVSKNTVKGCEEECNIYECTFFSFGISTGGNGTCELSTGREISKRQSSDYDLYQRTQECSQGKPTGYEEVCYRRLVSGRRLDERFIRHSLPCDSLEACQHQCSIEKHFKCQGFNIRWARQKVGGGICELSSVHSSYLDPSRDFIFDPEFDYFERDYSNKSPNCGVVNEVYGGVPKDDAGRANPNGGRRPTPFIPGGQHQGGDFRDPWPSSYGSGGYTTSSYGSWGFQSYGTTNFGRGPTPSYLSGNFGPGLYPSTRNPGPHIDYRPNDFPNYRRYGDKVQPLNPQAHYPDNRRYPSPAYPPSFPPSPPKKVPTYIIIDSEQDRKGFRHEGPPTYRPSYPRPPAYGPGGGIVPGGYGGPSGFGGPNGIGGPVAPGNHFPSPDGYFFGFSGTTGREVCFQRAHVGYRVDPKFARGYHTAPTLLECEAMCMNSPFKCTGYSYRYSVIGGEPNCALADFSFSNSKQNLLPDRSCDFYYKMPVCSQAGRSDDTECFLKAYSNQRIAPDKIRTALFVRGVSDCELECLKSFHFTCRSFTYRYGPGVIGEPVENCFLSDWPVKDLHPSADYIPGPGCEVYERGSYGHGCELDVGPPAIGPGFTDIGYPIVHDKYHWNRQETWRHFTVRGWPCRLGTQCQLNREAGFWSCEVEGGDRGQWDYCCKPGHHCGFSRGFYYPWCYVGEASPDQWRPCSEQYYPEFGNRPGFPYQPHGGHHYDDHKGNSPWNYGQEEYGPPSYWPVLYLYTEPPPNVTESWVFEDPQHSSYYLQGPYEDYDPKIQFRPSKNKFLYPKGIVLKIDVKDKPTASDPEHEAHKDEFRHPHIHPRYNYRKNLAVERVPVNDLNYPYFVKHNCEKEGLKLEDDHVASSTSSTLENYDNGNGEYSTTEKSKEVIRNVDKIIKEKMKEEVTKPEANETLSS